MDTLAKTYDRAAEDLGNIVGLEHVNLLVPDQRLATLFYVSALGLTRDPYMMTSVDNMWINVGAKSQFHLPTGKSQKLRGRTALVIPGREQLLRRLDTVKPLLEGTQYAFVEHRDHVEVTCPWGNTMLVHEPGPRFGDMQMGMPYVEFDVPVGAAGGIASFYDKVFDTMTRVDKNAAHISVGKGQELVFKETGTPPPAYDGHHIQVYVANFSRPHAALGRLGLVSEESNQYQYRFLDIVDPDSGKKLFRIEHEVRSITHPMYLRPLLNRNPRQNNRAYVPGRDGFVPEVEAEELPGRVRFG
jgi:catechol 2,3-dioxygenase-like lactoylglutathione lyase family enzyme